MPRLLLSSSSAISLLAQGLPSDAAPSCLSPPPICNRGAARLQGRGPDTVKREHGCVVPRFGAPLDEVRPKLCMLLPGLCF